jgi:hypothetical protein
MRRLLIAGVAAAAAITFVPLTPSAHAAPCVAGSSATCNACLMGSQEACAALGNPPPEVGPPPSYFPCGGTGLPPVAGPPTPGSPCRR